MLWGYAVVNTVQTAISDVVSLYRPCDKYDTLGCSDESIVSMVKAFNVLLLYTLGTGLVLHRFFYSALRRRLLVHRRPDHWTAAASRDVYQECSDAISTENSIALLILGTTSAIYGLVRILQLTRHRAASSSFSTSQEVEEYVQRTCGPGRSLCLVAFVSSTSISMASVGCMFYLICIFLATPIAVWSPTMLEAAIRTNNTRMRRLRFLPWGVVILVASSAVLMIIQISNDLSLSRPQMLALWLLFIVVLLCQTMLIAALNELDNPSATKLMLRVGARAFSSTVKRCIRFILSKMQRRVSPDEKDLENQHCMWSDEGGLCFTREAGVRQRQLILLVVHAFLWSYFSGTKTWWYNVMMWCYRLVMLALLLFPRDETAGFGDLSPAPAFGLVVDKNDLRRAITCHLNGQEFSGVVRCYKGSIFRMAETVSRCAVCTCPLHAIV